MASAPQVLPSNQGWRGFSVYPINFLALAPGAVANGNIQIQADSDFEWIKSTYQADIAAAAYLSGTRPIPNVTVNIIDGGTSRNLFNAPVPVSSIFGTGELPFILNPPWIFKANSNIQIQVQNFDAATTYNVRLAFVGAKIFRAC